MHAIAVHCAAKRSVVVEHVPEKSLHHSVICSVNACNIHGHVHGLASCCQDSCSWTSMFLRIWLRIGNYLQCYLRHGDNLFIRDVGWVRCASSICTGRKLQEILMCVTVQLLYFDLFFKVFIRFSSFWSTVLHYGFWYFGFTHKKCNFDSSTAEINKKKSWGAIFHLINL